MRSSAIASVVTVLLSLHDVAGRNIRRYAPSPIESLSATSSLTPSLRLNQRHEDGAHPEGESYAAQPAGSAASPVGHASASEDSAISTTFSFIPHSTNAGAVPSATQPALEEVESSLLASAAAASTNASATEPLPSTSSSSSTLQVGPSESRSTEALTTTTLSVPAASTAIPTGTHAVEQERSITTSASTQIPLSTKDTEEASSISTSNDVNTGVSRVVGEDGQCTQLSFVPTTIFATGEAPTVTVTAAPRTVTQVEVTTVTAKQETSDAQAPSAINLPASSGAAAEPNTITKTESASKQEAPKAVTVTSISRESCEAAPASTITLSAPSGASAEPIVITQILRASDGALYKQATVTEISTITLGTNIAAYGALEPVTVTQVVTQTVSADAAPTITDFKTRAGEALPAQTVTIIPNGIAEIDASPPSSIASPFPQNEPKKLEPAKPAAGGSLGPDGQCQCACPCAPDAFPSTTFPIVVPITTTKGFDAPASSEEPTTTLRETRSTFQTVVISGTSTAEGGGVQTEAPEVIELDTSAVPIIIASTLFSEPVISSIPAASFGVGAPTIAPASSPAEPTATSASASVVDTSKALDTPASVVLATSTIASSTAFVTTTAAPSSSTAEEAPVFTTTVDAPLATPEIGQIPKSQAAQGGESFEMGSDSATAVLLVTAVQSKVPGPTLAQAEAVVTPAPQEEIEVDGADEINSYELSSAIVLGNLGG